LIHGPAKRRSAGSSVTDALTIISTTTEMPTPAAVMNCRPATASPRIATKTVPPANTTDRPAVATVRAIDSSTDMPWARCSRWRDTINSA
jgi:hypothetical protein